MIGFLNNIYIYIIIKCSKIKYIYIYIYILKIILCFVDVTSIPKIIIYINSIIIIMIIIVQDFKYKEQDDITPCIFNI